MLDTPDWNTTWNTIFQIQNYLELTVDEFREWWTELSEDEQKEMRRSPLPPVWRSR